MESAGYFRPLPLYEGARARGCFTCTHFHGQFFYDHLLCEHRGGRHVVGAPEMGCAFWEREPGADDE
jgi:hypothetical protein